MTEEGLPPKEATRKSMGQVRGRIGGYRDGTVGGIYSMAFFGGAAQPGRIYRQFSITIVSAMALSVLVALILARPRCARRCSNPSPKGVMAKGKKGFSAGLQPPVR